MREHRSANGARDGRRRPALVVPAAAQMGGAVHRVVGSTDARGQGAAFPISAVGPFVLVGEARGLRGPNLPPFGDHPHAGLIAISHVPEGAPWHSRSNVPGLERLPLPAGDVLMTVAGRGIVHDEPSEGEGAHHLLQLVLRLPARLRDMPPTLERWSAVEEAPGVWRLAGPERLARAGVDAVIRRVVLPARGEVALGVSEAHSEGFVYTRVGAVGISGERVGEHHVAVLDARGQELHLSASASEPADCLVGLAAPMTDPWAKLLGHNGFVVAADEAAASAKLDEYEREGAEFGQGSAP